MIKPRLLLPAKKKYRYIYLMIFILPLIAITFTCTSHITSSKNALKSALDTTNLIISWYDFYVKDVKRKKIKLFKLPFDVLIQNSNYFDYNEVINYYTQNSTITVLEIFKSENIKNIKIFEQQLEMQNLSHNGDKSYEPISFKNDYLAYYFNKNYCASRIDMISDINCEDELIKTIETDLYGVDTSIENIIFSKHYISSVNDSTLIPFPESLKVFISASLEECKQLLSPDELEKVKNLNISYEKKQSILWVRSDVYSIYISPFIVRAAFLLTINETKRTFDFYYSHKDNLKSMNKTVDDLMDLNNLLLKRFKSTFYFILGHELAHIYLEKRSEDIITEKLCDCYSYKYLQSSNLGLYETILQKSIEHGLSKLWGVNNAGDLEERFAYLKFLQNQYNNLNCDKID